MSDPRRRTALCRGADCAGPMRDLLGHIRWLGPVRGCRSARHPATLSDDDALDLVMKASAGQLNVDHIEPTGRTVPADDAGVG